MAAPAPAQSRRRTRRPRAERQAEILASARQVFSDKGYGAAAVAEIAAGAGVVEGTVYSYFESKRSLLIAVMKGFFEELITDTESGLRAVRGTENQLLFVIRRHLETFTSEPGLCRVIISEARPDVALYDEAILELNRRYTGLALSVLEEGVENGSLRKNLGDTGFCASTTAPSASLSPTLRTLDLVMLNRSLTEGVDVRYFSRWCGGGHRFL